MPPSRVARPLLATSLVLVCLALVVATTLRAQEDAAAPPPTPPIESMSVLLFTPTGELLVGDSKAGAVWSLDLGERPVRAAQDATPIGDVETQIAALLGTRATEVMVHDLAVDPRTQEVYLAVSRGRGEWESRWQLPNDVADALLLIKALPDGTLEEVPLAGVSFRRVDLPNPVGDDAIHPWKKSPLRADTISDLALSGDTLYVAGLSNEEFASTLWSFDWPLDDGATPEASSIEIFHGAHGEYETHAPIRTMVPYRLGETEHLLAAYLCTPLVTLEIAALRDQAHVRGRTVAELGSGNYPLDMIVYPKDGREKLLIANSNLPWMIVDPRDIERFEGAIETEVEGYTAGVDYEIRSGMGIQQMDRLNDDLIVFLQRQPGGTMNLSHYPINRL